MVYLSVPSLLYRLPEVWSGSELSVRVLQYRSRQVCTLILLILYSAMQVWFYAMIYVWPGRVVMFWYLLYYVLVWSTCYGRRGHVSSDDAWKWWALIAVGSGLLLRWMRHWLSALLSLENAPWLSALELSGLFLMWMRHWLSALLSLENAPGLSALETSWRSLSSVLCAPCLCSGGRWR